MNRIWWWAGPLTRGGFLLAALAVVAACVPSQGDLAPRSVMVAGGAVRVLGPQGYCIDQRGVRAGQGGTFVPLMSCASLMRGHGDQAPNMAALLTASIADTPVSGDHPDRYNDALKDALRTVLRNGLDGGDPAARIIQADELPDVVILYVQSPRPPQGMQAQHWQALFLIRQRLITISVRAPQTRPLKESAARALLIAFVNRLRTGNKVAG